MRVFLQAAQTGSVSAAASACHLSQPAATQAISRLEQDLGTSLLIRRRQQAALTPTGALFAQRAEKALRHLRGGSQAALREARTTARTSETFDTSVTSSQLRNLIAISNAGSFSVAAQSLGLSQPSIHRTARSLEAIAGVPFFTARPSGVRLTAAAEAFVLGAKLAQSEIKQGIEEISRAQGQETGTFVLGSLPLARTSIVPSALHAIATAVQGFQVRVVEGRYAELFRSLREGDIDCLIGALRDPPTSEDVHQEHLFEDALAIVARPCHPLARKAQPTLDDSLQYPWIAPPIETPAGQYLFDTLRIHERPETPVRIVASSMAVLRGVLSRGNYLSVVSRHQIHVDEKLGVIAPLNIPLTGHKREIGLTYRTDWRPTQTQAQFIDFLRSYSTDMREC